MLATAFRAILHGLIPFSSRIDKGKLNKDLRGTAGGLANHEAHVHKRALWDGHIQVIRKQLPHRWKLATAGILQFSLDESICRTVTDMFAFRPAITYLCYCRCSSQDHLSVLGLAESTRSSASIFPLNCQQALRTMQDRVVACCCHDSKCPYSCV